MSDIFERDALGHIFRLNARGAAEILKKLDAGPINALAQHVADNAGDAVWVDEYTTDRPAASVTVPAARQAKHGTLTKAASSAGLEVKPPKRGKRAEE